MSEPPRRLRPFNLSAWLSAHRHELVPPIGNKLLYWGEFKVMIVAGPNSRTDYHVQCGEEWYYQLEGSMVLRVVDDGIHYDVPLGAGDTFCLPPGIPHSPQRHPNSLGIVVERERRSGELDTLRWYCQSEQCRAVLYSQDFFCSSLDTDLKPVIDNYFSDITHRTCGKCGFVEPLKT